MCITSSQLGRWAQHRHRSTAFNPTTTRESRAGHRSRMPPHQRLRRATPSADLRQRNAWPSCAPEMLPAQCLCCPTESTPTRQGPHGSRDCGAGRGVGGHHGHRPVAADMPHVQGILADDSGRGERLPVSRVGCQTMLGMHRVATEGVDGGGVQLPDLPAKPVATLVVGASASEGEDLQVALVDDVAIERRPVHAGRVLVPLPGELEALQDGESVGKLSEAGHESTMRWHGSTFLDRRRMFEVIGSSQPASNPCPRDIAADSDTSSSLARASSSLARDGPSRSATARSPRSHTSASMSMPSPRSRLPDPLLRPIPRLSTPTPIRRGCRPWPGRLRRSARRHRERSTPRRSAQVRSARGAAATNRGTSTRSGGAVHMWQGLHLRPFDATIQLLFTTGTFSSGALGLLGKTGIVAMSGLQPATFLADAGVDIDQVASTFAEAAFRATLRIPG